MHRGFSLNNVPEQLSIATLKPHKSRDLKGHKIQTIPMSVHQALGCATTECAPLGEVSASFLKAKTSWVPLQLNLAAQKRLKVLNISCCHSLEENLFQRSLALPAIQPWWVVIMSTTW